MIVVSVIMGTFNGENRVGKAIESILKQTYEDFELIICDDGSSDNTYEVLCAFKKIDNRIKILRNSENKKLSYTLNRCVKESKGKYIARMDDDDYSHHDRLEKQVEFLDNNSQYSLVGTSINYFDDNGILGTRNCNEEVSKLDILKGKTFVHPSVMIRKEALLAVGGYNESETVIRTEDLDLWVRLYAKSFKGYNIKDILLDYYEDSTSSKKRKYKYRIYEFNIRRKARKLLGVSFIYFPYVIKPLLIGLIPRKLIILYHKKLKNS